MAHHPFNGSRSGDFWAVRAGKPIYRLDAAKCGLNEKIETPSADLRALPRLEAALFLAKEPMSSRRLAQLANLPEGTRVRQLIRELQKRYDQDQSAFCITEVSGGFQLRTRQECAAWLVRTQGVPAAVRLSNPAMETLTVIAYRQPIPRADVERIRGVQCGDLIRQLLDQDLAKIVGRSDALGRPFLYGTTSKFLSVFGLDSLRDLPVLDATQKRSNC
jgi:segregation and condensation protein B